MCVFPLTLRLCAAPWKYEVQFTDFRDLPLLRESSRWRTLRARVNAPSIDLSLPLNGSINRDSPAWGTNLLNLYLETIEVFSKYDNVLAYNVGNEVANTPNTTNVMPFVKAAARDVKGGVAFLWVRKRLEI